MIDVIVLIPSYQPTHRLLEVVLGVRRELPGAHIVVVNDGSGPHYAHHFADTRTAGATVLTHPHNRGKGAALKTGMMWLTGNLVVSVIVARLISGFVNFTINRMVVFRATHEPAGRQAVRYAIVAGTLLASNLAWMTALTTWGLAWPVAKVVTESVLFIMSFQSQRTMVFGRREVVSDAPVTVAARRP